MHLIGPDMDPDMAYRIAIGEIDPITKQPFLELYPIENAPLSTDRGQSLSVESKAKITNYFQQIATSPRNQTQETTVSFQVK